MPSHVFTVAARQWTCCASAPGGSATPERKEALPEGQGFVKVKAGGPGNHPQETPATLMQPNSVKPCLSDDKLTRTLVEVIPTGRDIYTATAVDPYAYGFLK